jgi:FixJ family two-component response regulator
MRGLMNKVREMKIEHITKFLPCQLTEYERRDRGILLAKTVQDIALTEERHANVKAQLKAELQGLQAQESKLAGAVARGEESRDVRVSITYDFAELSVAEHREDTGEELSRRAMTEAERQMPLPGVK